LKIGILEIWLPDDLELHELPAKFYTHPFNKSTVTAGAHRPIYKQINENDCHIYNFLVCRKKGRKKEGKKGWKNERERHYKH
jgi:hypothetical protein